MSIAKYTGVWRAACKVFINKIIYYEITEFPADIQNIMGETIRNSQCPCVIYAVKATAAGFFGRNSPSASPTMPASNFSPHRWMEPSASAATNI